MSAQGAAAGPEPQPAHCAPFSTVENLARRPPTGTPACAQASVWPDTQGRQRAAAGTLPPPVLDGIECEFGKRLRRPGVWHTSEPGVAGGQVLTPTEAHSDEVMVELYKLDKSYFNQSDEGCTGQLGNSKTFQNRNVVKRQTR